MTKMFFSDYIAKVTLLEKHLGATTKYEILESMPVDPHDIISLNRAAIRIRDFMGLSGVTFVVAVDQTKDGVGGHISTHGNEPDVTISERVAESSEATLATLAHELTHKFLYTHGLRGSDSYDNEILTDIAAIYLGLGKIMLNGCQTVKRTETMVPTGIIRNESRLTVGYLKPEQLAFVYRLICTMRSTPSEVYYQGLTDSAHKLLVAVEHEHVSIFTHSFNWQETKLHYENTCSSQKQELQTLLAYIEACNVYVKFAFCESLDSLSRTIHGEIAKMHSHLVAMESSNFNPSMRYLRFLSHLDELISQFQAVSFKEQQLKELALLQV